MKENNTPEPIIFSDPIFDFSFHPKKNLVVAGLITGHVYCYQYDNDANILQWSTQISKKSCRGVEFNHDGSLVMTISRDKSIQTIDMTTGRLLQKIPKAHRYPINKIHALDINRIATGDDEGVIKV
ncbi:WD40-repeat-containing domain protein [Halteromyces radiatus]|uniref:WD40-repeat-containing domain protein n=1 Tax=Halteromyces radiatus TaxID=101107 RepID=UPI00221FD409|nr:WD40-repeat-containing domain protein [Halteromyces radiatus]KAI8099982.1 WD40-repeat-containing domain protein [Halteromyces radiatus]